MVTLGWFVCPSVSMVTTSKSTGLEKTLYQKSSDLQYNIKSCRQLTVRPEMGHY